MTDEKRLPVEQGSTGRWWIVDEHGGAIEKISEQSAKYILTHIEFLKQERDRWKEDGQKLVTANLKKDKALVSAEDVVDTTDVLLTVKRGRESCETIPEWVMQRIESVQAANARHREAHPAEEGEKRWLI